MNNRETIEGVEGEWRTVTKADDVTVGQRVICDDIGKVFPKVITSIKGNIVLITNGGETTLDFGHLFDGIYENIQAFFPIAKPAKPRKRPSKYERLLKALLASAYVWDAIESCVTCEVSESDYKQLIAIKESMQKGTNV